MDDDTVFVALQSDNSDCHSKRKWATPRVILSKFQDSASGKSHYSPVENVNSHYHPGPPS
jgi:hypothetical protein